MAPFVQSANVTVTSSGSTEIVENPYALISEAATHGQQRGSVVRVHSFNIQNQNTTNQAFVTWQDSNLTNIAGPFIIPVSTGNWTERATPPGFLFETTRNTSSGVGFDLNLNTNTTAQLQVFCEYSISFAPGRVAG